MGLIINKELINTQGLTIPSSSYLNVTGMVISEDKDKNKYIQAAFNTYVSKEARTSGLEPFRIKDSNGLVRLHTTMEELSNTPIYNLVYTLIKETLTKELGDVIVDDN